MIMLTRESAKAHFQTLIQRIRALNPNHRFLRLLTLLGNTDDYGPACYSELNVAASYALKAIKMKA